MNGWFKSAKGFEDGSSVVMDFQSQYDPRRSWGAEKTQEEGAMRGRMLANGHYPYAVVEDKQDLRRSAAKECDRWWGTLGTDYEKVDDFAEVKRIYVAAYVSAYAERVEQRRSDDSERREREREREEAAKRERAARDLAARGVSSKIVSKRDREGAVTYEIEFLDPARMTKPVSFGIQVGEDGEVDVLEL